MIDYILLIFNVNVLTEGNHNIRSKVVFGKGVLDIIKYTI